MKQLSDQALALAKLFAMGPGFKLCYKRGRASIYPDTLRALEELVDAKVIAENEVQLAGVVSIEYLALAKARTVGRVMSDARARRIKLITSAMDEP